jgi:KDO2-lipid IV(A) lauroyltransferase
MEKKWFSTLPITFSGRIFYYFLPIRKQIVLGNIGRVFKDNSITEKKRVAKAFYSHLATLLKELIMQSWMSQEQFDDQIEIKGEEYINKAVSQGKGCIILTGHLGNWEWGGLGLAQLIPKIGQINIIRRAIRLKFLEKIIFSRFERRGIKCIDSVGAMKHIKQAFQHKESVVFTMDQHAQITTKAGLAMDFFGIKAGTYTSLAYFAQNFKIPVVPMSMHRQRNGMHVIEFHPTLEWEDNPDTELAMYNNTLRYNQALERMILEHPEQWWWVHRRWKL